MRVVGEHAEIEVALSQIVLDPPIAGAPRVLNLPDGAQLQTSDHAAVDALFPRANRFESWVHRLERRWPHALGALGIVIVFSTWSVIYGLPLAAKVSAGFVPLELEAKLGEQALVTIDRVLCGQSGLDHRQQQTLRKSFETLTTGLGDGYRYRLEMRSCPRLGPNAFALPGGVIVLSDQLVELAQNDAQVSAVLAHEIGHVRHRHGLRQTLQAAGLAALIAALANDAVAITNLAAALPTILLESSYSRDFEDEADTYAFERLKEVGLSPRSFAEIMSRLEEFQRKSTGGKREGGTTASSERALDYLSTHPATAKRIERALSHQ
jgi:Zn-dependent protease with chaperone function